jgi:AcrR family transcriptional regulator
MVEDRRIQRSKHLLRDALVELILEHGYDHVKVAHITERANLARATFYLHYKDKDELLTKSLYESFDELIQEIGKIEAKDVLALNLALRKLPFEHAKKHRDLYRVALMSPHGISTVSNNARLYISQHLAKQLIQMMPKIEQQIALPIVSNYLAGALLAVISWWIEDGQDYSTDYMAQSFQWLAVPTISMLMSASMPPAKG